MECKRNYIYRYRDNGQTLLCVYICNTQAKNRIMIVPLTPNESSTSYKLSVTRQYVEPASFKEIYKSDLESPLYIGSKHIRISKEDAAVIHHAIIGCMMEQISSSASGYAASTDLFEEIYEFIKWKKLKLSMNMEPYMHKTTIFENAVYWASLGVNVGTELNKSRPVLIWKKRCSGDEESNFSYIVIPITSRHKSQKYYMNVPIEINGSTSYLRLEDMRRINIRRISRPLTDDNGNLIFISRDKRHEIMDAMKRFYIFDNMYNNK